ncbi:MAG: hypothetical protein ACO2YV_05465, partial [Pseudomonadales bacterium]
MHFDDLPRVTLGHLPTPLEPLASLQSTPTGPRVWVKRDDCTGLAVPGEPISIPGGGVRVPFLQRPDGRPALYRLNPFFGEIYQIGNYNEADYDAVVLQILRQCSSWHHSQVV